MAKLYVNNNEINFKVRFKSDSYKNKTITYEIKPDISLNGYEFEKIEDFITDCINTLN